MFIYNKKKLSFCKKCIKILDFKKVKSMGCKEDHTSLKDRIGTKIFVDFD